MCYLMQIKKKVIWLKKVCTFIFQEFFLNVKDLTRISIEKKESEIFDQWTTEEAKLQTKFNTTKEQVYGALCGTK